MKKRDPILVGEALDDFFKKRRLKAAAIEGKAVEIWRDVAGDYLAEFTEDVYIRNQILYITLSSSAARFEVHMRSRYYTSEINRRLGSRGVKKIIVR